MRHVKKKHKHFVLDEAKIERARRLLGARTATETIETALDALITERERNALVWQAHERFLRSGVRIKDVYGRLDD